MAVTILRLWWLVLRDGSYQPLLLHLQRGPYLLSCAEQMGDCAAHLLAIAMEAEHRVRWEVGVKAHQTVRDASA